MFALEKLCIELIVQKFERFYFAFTVSKDKNLQRNFQFLQRRYSVQFLKALYKDKKLKYEYFEILINEHLNFLDGKWLKNGRSIVFMEDIFRRLTNLTRIHFRDCGDEILENVANFCPKIIEIDVNGSNVTDNGVKYLCETKNGMAPCPQLKNIFLDGSDVTDNGVENLIKNLPSLEKIGYRNVPLLLHSIHEENVRECKNTQFCNLVQLNLFIVEFYSNYKDVLKSCLTVCPKLESLACYILDEEDLNLFTKYHLKIPRLDFFIGDQKMNMDKFLKMNGWNLTYLQVTDCTMSLTILEAYCPNLRQFSGEEVNFTDDTDGLKLNFAFLTRCRFKEIDPSFNKSVCLLLSSSPNLESIILESCELSLEMKIQILLWCKNPCAKRIVLNNTPKPNFELEFLKDILLNCPSLEMMLVRRKFMCQEIIKTLRNIAKRLPNKPLVSF